MFILIFYLIIVALFGVPFAVIFRRAGMAPWWAAFTLIPGLGVLVCMALLAFRTWPNQPIGYY